MIPLLTFKYVVIGWIIFGAIIFFFLLRITAPYGRHSSKKWGPMINNRVAWIIMELPALVFFGYFVIKGRAQHNILIWIFFGLWTMHYINRTFIFPSRIKTKGKQMPLLITLFAIMFNFMNGFLNGYWFGFLSPQYPLEWLYDPRFILGILLFIIGILINQSSDKKLLDLRNGEHPGYSIPYGGLFQYVSCPNFFGEIIQWFGFALMTWCLPTFAFFFWTLVNLVPRALDHHRWYRSTFNDYPKERKALLPHLL